MNNHFKNVIILVTFIFLTIFNSNFFIKNKLNTYFEIFSYLMLCCEVMYFLVKEKDDETNKTIIRFLVVFFLLSIGIMIQIGLPFNTKIRLLFTSFVIACVTTCSKKLLGSHGLIRMSAYGIMIGIAISSFLSLIAGIPLQDVVKEGIFNIGFNGGIQYKNFFATTVLASFMGLYIYRKSEKKSVMDNVMMIIQVLLIFLSSSRGTMILLCFFFAFSNCGKFFKKYNKAIHSNTKIKTVTITLTMVIIALTLCVGLHYVKNSSTYMYRARGVYNYVDFYKNDPYHLIFGDSKSAFEDPKVNYVWNIRKHLKKYDGSYEMGFINVLIKNGIVGLIGYLLIFVFYFKKFFQRREKNIFIISLLVTLLFSSLVESYVCNIHAIFGVFCYILINSLLFMEGGNK